MPDYPLIRVRCRGCGGPVATRVRKSCVRHRDSGACGARTYVPVRAVDEFPELGELPNAAPESPRAAPAPPPPAPAPRAPRAAPRPAPEPPEDEGEDDWSEDDEQDARDRQAARDRFTERYGSPVAKAMLNMRRRPTSAAGRPAAPARPRVPAAPPAAQRAAQRPSIRRPAASAGRGGAQCRFGGPACGALQPCICRDAPKPAPGGGTSWS